MNVGERHLHGTCYGAIKRHEELYVDKVYYPVLRQFLSWNGGLSVWISFFSSTFLPPSFLSLTLCIFFMFNKVLSVVTTRGCVGGGFWWNSWLLCYAVMFNSELISFAFHNNMLHSCSREGKQSYISQLLKKKKCRPKTYVGQRHIYFLNDHRTAKHWAVCMGFLWVIRFPSTSEKHRWPGYIILSLVNEFQCVCGAQSLALFTLSFKMRLERSGYKWTAETRHHLFLLFLWYPADH